MSYPNNEILSNLVEVYSIPCLPRPIFNYLILYSLMYLIYYCQNLYHYIMFWISSAQSGPTTHYVTCLHSKPQCTVIIEQYSITIITENSYKISFKIRRLKLKLKRMQIINATYSYSINNLNGLLELEQVLWWYVVIGLLHHTTIIVFKNINVLYITLYPKHACISFHQFYIVIVIFTGKCPQTSSLHFVLISSLYAQTWIHSSNT